MHLLEGRSAAKIFYDDFFFCFIEPLSWIFIATQGMFTGSSTVRTFVIPHVCGTAGQRYFLGKHGQNKTKQKKVREVPQPDPDAFWVPLYSFHFEFTIF